MGTAVHGDSGFDEGSGDGCRHELPYGRPRPLSSPSAGSLDSAPRPGVPAEPLARGLDPATWLGSHQGYIPLDQPALLCHCVASVPGHGGGRR